MLAFTLDCKDWTFLNILEEINYYTNYHYILFSLIKEMKSNPRLPVAFINLSGAFNVTGEARTGETSPPLSDPELPTQLIRAWIW